MLGSNESESVNTSRRLKVSIRSRVDCTDTHNDGDDSMDTRDNREGWVPFMAGPYAA